MSDCAKKCKKENGFYGTTTLGERGQVVIPAKAREDFKLEKGEQLLVFGMGKGPSDLKEMFEPMRKGPMGDPVEKFFNELLWWARALKRARMEN